MKIFGQGSVLIYKTNRKFWISYSKLPIDIQNRANEKFELLKQNSRHPSIRLKKIGEDWVVRITKDYRALATEEDGCLIWYWIGKHEEYIRRIRTN